MAETNEYNDEKGNRIVEDEFPNSWDQLDVEHPPDISSDITPRELEVAAEKWDTLFEVCRDVRGDRTGIRRALSKLGLRDQLASTSPDDLISQLKR
jgi:hypothetical protein